MDSILIDRRFCGPPDSGNGGYTCGRLAAFVEGPALVRLQVPPPLGVELTVRKAAGGVELVHGASVVAWARASEVSLQVPAAPAYEEAEAAARGYRGFQSHPFPTCFVCGPGRGPGDGLRVFAGPLGRDKIVAAPWTPDPSLAGGGSQVPPEFLWAALDCPGAFSFDHPGDAAVVLGEMAAQVAGSAKVGERCVVIGWELGREGRKHHTGTALFSESGERIGVARATWFEVPRPPV
jgi:hypothetical protein